MEKGTQAKALVPFLCGFESHTILQSFARTPPREKGWEGKSVGRKPQKGNRLLDHENARNHTKGSIGLVGKTSNLAFTMSLSAMLGVPCSKSKPAIYFKAQEIDRNACRGRADDYPAAPAQILAYRFPWSTTLWY